MVRTLEKRQSPEESKFDEKDLKKFKAGDAVVFLHDGEWSIGVLNKNLRLNDSKDKIMADVFVHDLGAGMGVMLDELPRKFSVPSEDSVDINGKKFTISNEHVKANGVVYVDLISPDDADKPIRDVNLELLHAVEKADAAQPEFQRKVKELADRVLNLAGEQSAEVKADFVALQKRIVEMPLLFGAATDWSKMADSKVRKIRLELAQLMDEVDDSLLELESNIRDVEKQAAKVKAETPEAKPENEQKVNLAKRVFKLFESKLEDRDAQAAVDYKQKEREKKQEIKDYQAALAAWNGRKNAAAKQKPPVDFTEVPPVEPDELVPFSKPSEKDKTKQQVMNEVFEDLVSHDDPELTVHLPEVRVEVEKFRKEEAKARLEKGGDYPAGSDKFKEGNGRSLAALMEKWQTLPVPEKVKINLDKEQKELVDKCDDLWDKISVGIGSEKIRDYFQEKLENQAEKIGNLDQDSATLMAEILVIKKDLAKLEIEAEVELHRSNKSASVGELASHEKRSESARLNKETVLEIMNEGQRGEKLRAFWLVLYNAELGEGNFADVHKKFLEIFADAPQDKDLLDKLWKECGIRDWKHLKDILKGEAGMQAAMAMRQMAQENLRNRVLKEGSTLGKLWAQKKYYGVRILATAACVGGGVLAFKLVLPAAAAAYLGASVVTGAGGGIGGYIRGLLQKKIFNTDKSQEKKAEQLKKYEDELSKKLYKEMELDLFEKNLDDTNSLFSTIIAQTLNEAVAKVDQGEEPTDIGSEERMVRANYARLDAEGQRLYHDGLMELHKSLNKEPDKQQRLTLVLGLVKLREMSQVAEKKSGPLATKAKEAEEVLKKYLVKSITEGFTGEWASLDGWQGKFGHLFSIAGGAGAALAMQTNTGRFIYAGTGGALGGLMETERKMEVRDIKEGEKILKKYFDVFDNVHGMVMKVSGKSDFEEMIPDLFYEYTILKNVYRGNVAGDLDNQKVVSLLRTSEIHRVQVRERLDKAEQVLLKNGLSVLAEAQQAIEARGKSQISRFDKFKKGLGRSAEKIWGGVWRGAALGAASVAVGETVSWASHTEAAQNSVEWMKSKFGLVSTASAAELPHHRAGVAQESAQVTDQAASARGGKGIETSSAQATAEIKPAHTPTVEHVAHREPGMFAPEGKAANFSDWRHEVMKSMGYKFEGGKVLHALRFQPGAKIELIGADGKTLDQFEFEHGDSTWKAMDHFQKQASGLIQKGETPTIKIVDNGKVEVLGHYRVESHVAGHTEIAPAKALASEPKLEFKTGVKNLPAENFQEAPLAGGHLSDANLRHAENWSESGDVIKGKDGKIYSVMYPDNNNVLVTGHAKDVPGHHIRYVDTQRHVYDGQGKYLGDVEKFGGHGTKEPIFSERQTVEKMSIGPNIKGAVPKGWEIRHNEEGLTNVAINTGEGGGKVGREFISIYEKGSNSISGIRYVDVESGKIYDVSGKHVDNLKFDGSTDKGVAVQGHSSNNTETIGGGGRTEVKVPVTKTAWSRGGAVENKAALESALKGNPKSVETPVEAKPVASPQTPELKIDKPETNLQAKPTLGKEVRAAAPGEYHPDAKQLQEFSGYLNQFENQWNDFLNKRFAGLQINTPAKQAITGDVRHLFDVSKAGFDGSGKANREIFAIFQSGDKTHYADQLNNFIRNHASAETKLFLFGTGGDGNSVVDGVKALEVDSSGSHAIALTKLDGSKLFLYDAKHQYALNGDNKLIMQEGDSWKVVKNVSFNKQGAAQFNY